MNAADFRRLSQEKRKALKPEQVGALSDAVVARFLAAPISPARWKGLRVALYRAMAGELDPSRLAEALSARGARLHYPRIVDRDQSLIEMAYVADPVHPKAWKKGPYGIEEPSSDQVAPPGELDLILVPGAAYGEGGERIGLGSGYYDRYLAQAARALRVALIFDFQLHARLPQSPWDQPVHWIFSEKREKRLPGAEQWLSSP